jgi:hypothetical protein
MGKLLLILLAGILMLGGGCTTAPTEPPLYRIRKHLEYHFLVPYKQLVELHREIDWYFFGIDEMDPGIY